MDLSTQSIDNVLNVLSADWITEILLTDCGLLLMQSIQWVVVDECCEFYLKSSLICLYLNICKFILLFVNTHKTFLLTGYYQTETFANHKHETTSQVAANETVDTGADAQTIMIIQDRDAYTDSKDGFLVQPGQVCTKSTHYTQ